MLGRAELEMQRCRISLPETCNLPKHGGKEEKGRINKGKPMSFFENSEIFARIQRETEVGFPCGHPEL